jgi:beta-galactosidase GanA
LDYQLKLKYNATKCEVAKDISRVRQSSWLLRVCFVVSFSPSILWCQTTNIPNLSKQGSATQLIVNNKPFLVLGGELGNSSASSLQYLKPTWLKLKQMHVNTVLAPVYWELIEPEEGKYNFNLLDTIISDARANNLHLILLWFGAWKNSMSTYVPAWVKTNQQRFPRAQKKDGSGMEILSAFSNNNLEADKKAFTALIKHVKEVDAAQSTVIMVQVENEIGMLEEAREYTPAADAAFKSEIPKELINYLQKNRDALVPEFKERWAANGYVAKGTWEQVFGKGLETDEIFQAWYYAKYTNAVAQAGKAAYNIPMYVNAALNYKNVKPGQYPSAGPLPHLMNIWQTAAPAIDILSPDFYNPYFKHYNDLYTRTNNPLFIPEIRFEPSDAAKVFYAIGHYNAIGFSPFSIESTNKPEEEPITKSYEILEQLTPAILKYGATGKMDGVLLDTQTKKQTLALGNYQLTVSHDYTLGWSPEAKKPDWPMSGGLVIQTAEDELVVAGTGIVITFTTVDNVNPHVGILQADEGEYVNGQWVADRRMNGDQTHQGRHIRIPAGEWGIQYVKLYRYK